MAERRFRVDRVEHKYLLSAEQASALCGRLRAALREDAHGEGGGYLVRSLYLDTPQLDDLCDKLNGVCARKKIRLRRYGDGSDNAWLEQKQKYAERQRKTSLAIGLEGARLVIDGGVPLPPDAEGAAETAAALARRRPSLLMEYRRRAFVWPGYDTRITVDSDIRYSGSFLDFFSEHPRMTPLDMGGGAVLEVKYSGALERFVAELISPFCGGRLSYGKYERCMMSYL